MQSDIDSAWGLCTADSMKLSISKIRIINLLMKTYDPYEFR